MLTEALSAGANRLENAEHKAGESAIRRNEMEAELTQMRQALTHLRQELEAAKRGRMAYEKGAAIEKSRLEARAQELQTAQAQTDEQIKKLQESLATETQRREAIKQRVAEHADPLDLPVREIYVVGAADTDEVDAFRTEICWPIRSRHEEL